MDAPHGDGDRPPVLNIVGERVALGPLRRELLADYTRWRNDFTMLRTLSLDPVPTPFEELAAWYERAVAETSKVRFTVYERAPWRPIGLANLNDLDRHNGTAEYGIVIGEADARGRGTEATILMLDYAFTALGLHSVLLRTYAYNYGGLRAYAKAGFREFGRRHECRVFAGQRWDEVHMECLASEFTSPILGGIFAPDPESA
jgi:RimJ/RimL family protein N-acetyltransferase